MPTIHDIATDAAVAAEQQREKDERVTVWAFVWTLFAFKLATAVAIAWAATDGEETALILGATHWFWILIPAVAVAGPLLFHLRLRRVRRRRELLRRAEWLLAEPPPSASRLRLARRPRRADNGLIGAGSRRARDG